MTMNPARNLGADTLHSSKSHQSSSDHYLDLRRLDWPSYIRSLDAAETNFDIATTHKSNDELRESLAVQKFFDEVRQIKSLVDDDKRKWMGTLPSKMTERAIPLFTDYDTGTDFQLHFSYTWMRVLHTAGTKSARVVDPFVHSLVHVTDSSDLELISDPDIVIPLGKLFINKSGHSTWTGYEILVSNKLSLWIIDILGEIDPQELYPDEVRRSRRYIPGSGQNEQSEAASSTSIKIARLWDSLQTIDSATFQKAGEDIRELYDKDFLGSIYLLELSKKEASWAVSLPDKHVYKTFTTSKFKVSEKSRAGRELLLLANDNPKKAIMELKFEEQAEPSNIIDRQLVSLAAEHEEATIIHLLLKNSNVNVNSVDELGKTPLSYAIVNAHKHTAKYAGEAATLKAFVESALNDESLVEPESESDYLSALNAIKTKYSFAASCATKHAADSAAHYAASSTVSATASLCVSTAAFFAAHILLKHVSQEAGEGAAQGAAEYARMDVETYADAATGKDIVNTYAPEDVIRRAIRKAVQPAFPDLISSDPYAFIPGSDLQDIRRYANAYAAEYRTVYDSMFDKNEILNLLRKYEQTYRKDRTDMQTASNLAGERSGFNIGTYGL